MLSINIFFLPEIDAITLCVTLFTLLPLFTMIISRCSTGEGIFRFTTSHGEEIIREIKKAVSNLASKKSTLSSPSRKPSSSTSCEHESCSRLRSYEKEEPGILAPGLPAPGLPVHPPPVSSSSLRSSVKERSRESSLKRFPSTSGSSFSSSVTSRPSNTSDSSNIESQVRKSYNDDDYINDQLIEDPIE